MDDLLEILSHEVGPWTVGNLLAAFAILLLAIVVRAVLVAIIGKRVEKLSQRTATKADDIAARAVIGPLGLLVVLVGIYIAFRYLTLSFEQIQGTADQVFKTLITIGVAWIIFRLVNAMAVGLEELAGKTESKLDDQLIPLLRKAAKLFIGVLTFVMVVQNLGYSVSGLLAGLGIGGLAFALAAKDTIANLFGSVTILIDRPFLVGDWVTTGDSDGVVEEIGLRSTRIRTFAKTVISIPNQVLANTTVDNHSLMPKRRIKMTVGVTYDSTPDQMRQAVARIEQYLKDHDGIDQEFMLVKFTEFNDSSLDIFVYCFTKTTDWTRHLELRQEVNLAIMDILAALGMGIAFPTRTVHLAGGETVAHRAGSE
ncbi:MAG: mechanosensitive ion channel family protein [bacterium]